MKRIVCLLLCVVFICAGFNGCTPQDSGETTLPETVAGGTEHTLRVGYGRVNITPEGPVPLAGRLSVDFSDSVTDPLYATCIAFTDETDNTVLMFHLDLLENYGEVNLAKLPIAKATGVNGLQIMMCATHNHSSPRVELPEAVQVVPLFLELLALQVGKIVDVIDIVKAIPVRVEQEFSGV